MAKKISLTQAVQTSAPRKTKSAEEQLEDLGLLSPRKGSLGERGLDPIEPHAPPVGEFIPDLLLKNIFPSPTNPRKTFDQAELQGLADSIKAHGVLEPLVVRTIAGKPKGVCELVAGERRFRAAQLAGVERVPARLFTISDEVALEWQLVENLQRQDLDPLEEALGFQQAMNELGWSADQLAERTKKSKSTIYSSLKLLNVPQILRKALREGDVSAETAKLVGRLPNAEHRQEISEWILQEVGLKCPPTFREVKDQIEGDYMVELKGAPFDLGLVDLVPHVGTCHSCPLRTGNNRVLYPEGRADICTSPPCFRAKVIAAGQRKLDQARKAGRPVLDGKSDIFYEHGGLKNNTGYEDLTRTCHEDPKYRNFGEVLGKEAEEIKVLAMDGKGEVHELVPAKALKDLIKKKFPDARRASSGYSSPPRGDSFDYKVKVETRRRLMAAAAEKAEVQGIAFLGANPKFLSPLVVCLLSEFWCNIITHTAKRRGVDDVVGLRAIAEAGNAQTSLALLAELAVCKSTEEFSGDQGRGDKLRSALGIDKKKIEAEAKAALKAKKKAGKS